MPRKKIRMTGGEQAMAMAEAQARAEKRGAKVPEDAKLRKRTAYRRTPGIREKPMEVYDVVVDRKYLGVRYAITEIAPDKYYVEILNHPFPSGAGYPSISKHRYISGGKSGKGKAYEDLDQAERCTKAAIRDIQVWFERRGLTAKRSKGSGRAKQTKGARAQRKEGAIARSADASSMPQGVRDEMRKAAPKVERSRELRRLGKAGGKEALSAELSRAKKRLEHAQIEAQAKLLPKVMGGGFKQKGARATSVKQSSAQLKKLVDKDPKVQQALEEVRRIERAKGALAMEERILGDDRRKNPSAAVHMEVGRAFLVKSEKNWERFLKNKSTKALLDAYEDLIIAHKELEYAKDSAGIKQAKQGLRAARAELKSRVK